MQKTIYIIKDDKIYEVTSENEAVKVDIVKGIPKKGKETIEYNPAEDFPYAFFEIRAKYSYLFEQPEEIIEKVEQVKEEKPNKSKSKTETKNEE